MVEKIKKYILKNKKEFILIFLILLLAAFLRLYRISDYMTFLGDEGRDALVAKGILQGNLTLLGPRASAGDFFLGPVYYYMIAPFLWLTNLDPVGPAIMVALFGIATVFLVFYIGKKLISVRVGLIAAALYTVSPLVIAYSRSSWNPNLMPFFSLLILYLLYVAIKNKSNKLFLFIGFLLGIAIQLHYLTVFLGVIIFLFVLISEPLINKKDLVRRLINNYLLMAGGFFVGLSPFLAFEARHGFPNTRAIFKFIFEDNATKNYIPQHSFVINISDVFFRVFGRLVAKYPPIEQITSNHIPYLSLWSVLTLILAIASVVSLFFLKDKIKILLFGLWLGVGVLLFGIYKKPIYDYYFGFMFPLPFFFVSILLDKVMQIKSFKPLGMVIGFSVFIIIFLFNLAANPFMFPANKQKDQAKGIAEFVISKTGNKPFNFALMTDGNSDHVYRYFFEIEDHAPVTLENIEKDPQRKSVTDQLMIICEKKVCGPLGDSLWEIAGFGRAEIAGEWQTSHVKVFRLVHYSDKS